MMSFFFQTLNTWKRTVSAILFVLLTSSLVAQVHNLRFEHIGSEQGLTTGSVLSILQDRQGFMWFGTKDGLFRFDGYKHDRLQARPAGFDLAGK